MKKFFNPDYVSIGKDVKQINYNNNYVEKYFKNKFAYQQTLYFYDNYKFSFIPKLLSKDSLNNLIIQEYVGNLLSLKTNLPKDWEYQLNYIRKEFIKNNIYIEDLRFLPYTPLIVNNLTVINKNIYIVDLTMVVKSTNKYINYKFDNLIFQIKMYLFLLKYINYFFLIVPHIIYHIILLIFNW